MFASQGFSLGEMVSKLGPVPCLPPTLRLLGAVLIPFCNSVKSGDCTWPHDLANSADPLDQESYYPICSLSQELVPQHRGSFEHDSTPTHEGCKPTSNSKQKATSEIYFTHRHQIAQSHQSQYVAQILSLGTKASVRTIEGLHTSYYHNSLHKYTLSTNTV